MEEYSGERKIYFIPDNFIEEGRVFQGRFRIRYLLEGILLGILFASVAGIVLVLHPSLSLEVRICLLVFTGGPGLAAGIAGYNGDPISIVIRSAVTWSRHKTVMLYNPNPRLLKRDPLLSVINESRPVDELMETIEERRRVGRERKANVSLKEGTDFRFAGDRYVDEFTRRRRKRPAKDRNRKRTEEREYLIRPQRHPADGRAVPTGETDLTDDGAEELSSLLPDRKDPFPDQMILQESGECEE